MNLKRHPPLSILMIALLFVSISVAQQRKQSSARLNSSKPTVYITFNGAPADVNRNALSLKLHNNTRWKIICYLTPGQSKLAQVPIIYKVVDGRRSEVYSNHSGDVVFQKTVLPGKSVAFAVAKDHLKHGYAIYVEFNYAWEVRNGMSPYGVEPNHRVLYGWYDLPKLTEQ